MCVGASELVVGGLPSLRWGGGGEAVWQAAEQDNKRLRPQLPVLYLNARG